MPGVISVWPATGTAKAPSKAKTMSPGIWYYVTFYSDGAGGATTTDSFLLPGTSAMEIQYQDCCLPGDQYEIFADGVSLGLTTVSALPHPFDISYFGAMGGATITLGMPVFDGGLPAGSYIKTVTPEPATLLLMATGLMGLGIAWRRKED